MSIVIIVMALVAHACKVPSQKGNADQANPSKVLLPQRTGGDGKTTPEFDIDEQSGRSKPLVVARLDYFPTPAAGKTSLPACLAPFPGNFELGTVTCLDNGTVLRLMAKNVTQDCYTAPDFERVPASEPFKMLGCQVAQAFVHAFEPEILLDVEFVP